ncbi:coiled-coil domain-containing protein 34 isoform X3 [Anas platyrhynchos]|uniref:coiled-coil domain-containing protein 34 isoform X3 n=1 Tax=Anas platyrhynchos TaxID=8839 RepID=UPI003AF2A73D
MAGNRRPLPQALAGGMSSGGEEEEEGAGASPFLSPSPSPRGRAGRRKAAEDSEITEGKNQSPLKDSLSPWEEWFIGKEKELRARLQARAAEQMNIQLEKMKQKEECERRKRLAEEKHKEWMQKKREEERRERERKQSKEMAEKATRELEKMQLQEKAEVKYKEWLKKKRAEESEKKKREKEKEKEREAELQEKRERSEKIFQEWLHNARNKPRPVLNGYGFPHRKSTDEKCASKRKVEGLSLNHLNYVMYLLRCSCVFVSQIIFITAGIIKLVA